MIYSFRQAVAHSLKRVAVTDFDDSLPESLAVGLQYRHSIAMPSPLMNPTLSAERMAVLMETQDVAVEIVQQTVSTNQDLLDRIKAGQIARNTLLLAIEQTGGRGRNGRRWYADRNHSLTFSLAWHFSRPVPQIPGIPLTAGIAIAQILIQCGVRVQLKWPNDILKNGGKVAGILTESLGNQQDHWAVIGVGINLHLSDAMEKTIDQPAADLLWLAQMDRNRLMALLIDSLAHHLRLLDEKGFDSLASVWNNLHAHHLKPVTIVQGAEKLLSGIVLGIDRDGRLLIKTDKGTETVISGDVSLRIGQKTK